MKIKKVFTGIFLLLIILLCTFKGHSANQLQQDKQHFANQLKRFPNDADLNYNMARVNFLMGNIDEAIRFLERTIFLRPTDVQAHIRLAAIYRKIGKLAEARLLLQNAAALDSRNFEIWYELGILFNDLANYEQALHAFQKALQYSPDEENKNKVIYYTGLTHLSNRDFDRFKLYLQRLKKAPQYHKALKSLGQMWKNVP